MDKINNKINSKVVRANAGTGKTFFLAIEYIKCLLKIYKATIKNKDDNKIKRDDYNNTVNIDKSLYLKFSEILVITFTKAATAEIRNRIFKFLKILVNNKNETENKLKNEIKNNLEKEDFILDKNSLAFLEKVYNYMLINKHLVMIKTIDSFTNFIFKNFVTNYNSISQYQINNLIDEEHSQALLEMFLVELFKEFSNDNYENEKNNDFKSLVNYFLKQKNIAKNYLDLKSLFKQIFKYAFLILLIKDKNNNASASTKNNKLFNSIEEKLLDKKIDFVKNFNKIIVETLQDYINFQPEKELDKLEELKKIFKKDGIDYFKIYFRSIKNFDFSKESGESFNEFFETEYGISGAKNLINLIEKIDNSKEGNFLNYNINYDAIYKEAVKLFNKEIREEEKKSNIFKSNFIKKYIQNISEIKKKFINTLYPILLEINQEEITIYNNNLIELSKIIINKYLEFKKDNPEFTYNDITTLTYETLYDKNAGLIENINYNTKQDGFINIQTVSNKFYEFLSSKFRYILIDEFQDTSIIQWKLLFPLISDILSGESSKSYGEVIVVGDQKQSIYSWRGGEKKLFDVIESYINIMNPENQNTPEKVGKNKKELNKTFRNKKNIVDFINSVFKYVNNLKEIDFNYINTTCEEDLINEGYVSVNFKQYKGNKKSESNYENDEEILEVFLVDNIINKIDNINLSNTAIIARTNKELTKIANILSKYNIPYLNKSNQSIFDHKLIKPFIFLLNFLVFADFLSLLKFLRSNYINISDEEIKYFAISYKILRSKNNNNFEDLQVHLSKLKEIITDFENYSLFEEGILNYDFTPYKENLIKAIDKVINFLKKIKPFYNNPDIVIQTVKTFFNHFLEENNITVFESDLINNFFEIVLNFESSNSLYQQTYKGFLDFIKNNKENEEYNIDFKSNANAINLLTVHKAKGLEFDNVFVVMIFSKKRGSIYFNNQDRIKLFPYYNFNKSFSEINRDNFYLLLQEHDDFINKSISFFYNKNYDIKILSSYKVIKELIDIKINNIKREIEEEFNNFYVAITRARNYLNILFIAPDDYLFEKEKKNKSSKHKISPDNFYFLHEKDLINKKEKNNININIFENPKKYLLFHLLKGISNWIIEHKIIETKDNIKNIDFLSILFNTGFISKGIIPFNYNNVSENKIIENKKDNLVNDKDKLDWIKNNFFSFNFSKLKTLNLHSNKVLNKNMDISNKNNKITYISKKIESFENKSILKGTLVHFYLSFIFLPFENKNNENVKIKELITKIEEFKFARKVTFTKFGNFFNKKEIENIIDKVDEWICNNFTYFSNAIWDKVFNEFVIFDDENKMYRIDRLMINEKNKKAFIIDYKTGDYQHESSNQIEKYIKILKSYKIFKEKNFEITGKFINIET